MSIKSFVGKEDSRIPDSYGIEIFYIATKEVDKFEVAQHKILTEFRVLELATVDDEWFLIPLDNVRKISLDKNFSKVASLAREIQK